MSEIGGRLSVRLWTDSFANEHRHSVQRRWLVSIPPRGIDFGQQSRYCSNATRSGVVVPGTTSQPVSELLAKWRAGDEESLRRLVPLVYGELRRLAHHHLRGERPNHTLQTTALVHEAYLWLVKQEPIALENRAHFLAVCAQLMREILVQYARRRNAAKRGAGYTLIVDGAVAVSQCRSLDLVALDEALKELSKLDPQQSRIVELRFFGGLSIEETSRVLGVSPATVKRDWATARVWLHREMSSDQHYDA